IAWRRGGSIEAVEEGVTGEFIDEQSWEELADRVIHFDQKRYDPQQIRNHALKFDTEQFKNKLKTFVETKWQEHENRS
ncbi:MAG: glycosyltransferase family 4 protein, partial [Candidatus Uhrbacteria bacterium]